MYGSILFRALSLKTYDIVHMFLNFASPGESKPQTSSSAVAPSI